VKPPRVISRLALRLGGWTPVGAPPTIPKYVLIAQHTSGWDFVWMLAFASYYGIDLHWIGKDSLFRWPFGWLMRWWGGIPVDRSSPQDLVAQLANEFRTRDQLVLALAPEGTRHYVDHWHSGFLAIAKAAGVPIAPSRLDYGRRIGGFGGLIHPSDDVVADMNAFRAFYADQQNRHPELTGRVRLKSEGESTSQAGP
jgi:1-acyl-sn-glycerol-3-phosphate acyltransferase